MMIRQSALSAAVSSLAFLLGCHGSKDVKSDDPYSPDRIASVARNLKFHKVVIHPYTVDKSIEEPGTAATDCSTATLTYLVEKNLFSSVQVAAAAPADPDTLVVDADVQALRIVSGGARFWGGAFVGSSHMTLLVVATDASGIAVGHRAVSDANNAMGAAWSFGKTDRGLPSDMGLLVADAIIQLAQRSPASN